MGAIETAYVSDGKGGYIIINADEVTKDHKVLSEKDAEKIRNARTKKPAAKSDDK